jgi:serine/threonine protein kinase
MTQAHSLQSHSRSLFLGAAKMSTLLSEEQREEVLRAACAAVPGPEAQPETIDDEVLARCAVELGFITRWQAEWLKRGRNKFTLGEYLIIDELGAGGMGQVFKAEHSMLGRIEAIKVLPHEKTTPDQIARFQHEIRAHAKLNHPNLARLSYAGRDGSRYYFVTEYVPGTDLRKLVRKHSRLTMQEAATIISQAAEGLEHAHTIGVIHRDIKPGNLLVTPEGHTKVIDLGLAGFVTVDSEDQANRQRRLVGTPDYLAPEVIRNPASASPASDVYALGCTLYYAISGKVPYPGGTSLEKLDKHKDMNAIPLNPQRFNPELDQAFLTVLADMMDKNPQRRIQTAQEVVSRLAAWTLETVPNAGDIESGASFLPSLQTPQALEELASNSTLASLEMHFLDEGELPNSVRDSILHVLEQNTPASHSSEAPIRVEEADVARLPLGIYIYPSSRLVPLLMLLTVAFLGLLALLAWLAKH